MSMPGMISPNSICDVCRHTRWSALLGLSFVLLATLPALGDDGAMASLDGGMVALMSSRPSVRMVSETVTIRLTDDEAKVHCQFAFHNEGQQCPWSKWDFRPGRLSRAPMASP